MLEKSALLLRSVRLKQVADLRQATSTFVSTAVMLDEVCMGPETALDVPSAIDKL